MRARSDTRLTWLPALLLALAAAACRSATPQPFVPPTGGTQLEQPRPDPNAPRASVERTYYGDGVQLKHERQVLFLPGGRKLAHGREAAWHPDGTPEYEREFDHGEPSGVWKTWYRDGTPRSEVVCGATSSGTSTWWHENGEISSQGGTVGGLKQGPWVHRHANGQLEAEGEYRRGRRQGPWRLWDEHGDPEASGSYENGVRVGRWELWNESGEAVPRGTDDSPR